MKKWLIWFLVVVFLFAVGSYVKDAQHTETNATELTVPDNCGTRNENIGDDIKEPEADPGAMETIEPATSIIQQNDQTDGNIDVDGETESTQPSIRVLDDAEYWEAVKSEIIAMLNGHNLYIRHIDTRHPYVNIHVEPGIPTDEGAIVAKGLSQAECQELYEHIKAELHCILDKYMLAKPKTIFHACHSIVGIFIDNWFVNERKVYDRTERWQVAYYQLDLLEYYYNYDNGAYVCMEGFSTNPWSKYAVYAP